MHKYMLLSEPFKLTQSRKIICGANTGLFVRLPSVSNAQKFEFSWSLEKSHKGAACLFWRKVMMVLIWERRRKVIMVQNTPPILFWEKCHNGAVAISNQHHYDFSPEQTWSTFMTFLLLSRNRTIMTFLQNRHAAPLWLFSFFPKTAPLWLFSRTDMQHHCDFSPEQTCSTFVTFL